MPPPILRAWLSILSLALALGACGPLPRPFQPDQKPLPPAAGPDDPARVLVLPLTGDAPGRPTLAAAALAQALRNQGVSATLENGAAEQVLSGESSVLPAGNGEETIRLTWWLSDLSGRMLDRRDQVASLRGGLWERGQSDAVAGVMTDAARRLAPLLKDRPANALSFRRAAFPQAFQHDRANEVPAAPGTAESLAEPKAEKQDPNDRPSQMPEASEAQDREPSEPAPPAQAYRPSGKAETAPNEAASVGPRLVLVPMEGLPGDGARSLPRALARELVAAKVPIGTALEDGDLLLLGEVEVVPAEPGWEQVTISWWVVNPSDGKDLGQIDQANLLPSGSLDGPWGGLAQGIAQGAADGIVRLLKEHSRS